MQYSANLDEQQEEVPLLYSTEIEMAVLGTIIVMPDVANSVHLKVNDFYIDRHKEIYISIRECIRNGIVPDYNAVLDNLNRRNKLTMVGGASYLALCVSNSANSQLLESYVSILRDYSLRREVLSISSNVARDMHNTRVDFSLSVARAVDNFLKVVGDGHQGSRPISDVASEVYDIVVERANERRNIWGMPSGLPDIDNYLGGFHIGDMFLLAGEPGIGKSKLGLQIVLNFAKNGYGGVIYSIEMSDIAVVLRAISALGKINTRQMRSGVMDEDSWTRMTVAVDALSDMNIHICDKPITIGEMRADVARHKAKNNIKWVMIDYLMLLSGYDDLKEYEASAKLSRAIKQMSRDMEVFVLCIESTTKEAFDGGKVGKSVVRGSGQVIHDADLVGVLTKHSNDALQDSIVTLHFTKTRDIEVGPRSFDLYAHRLYPMFSCTAY